MEHFLTSLLVPFFVLLVVLTTVYAMAKIARKDYRYKYDDKNPYRRYCKKCNSMQVMYENQWGDQWWSEIYQTDSNPDCECHKDVESRDW